MSDEFAPIRTMIDNAHKMRAYESITAQYGPSEQLLAFMNYDGKLRTDMGIGLESFDSFSLQTRHEIILSTLNPDALEHVALEGLMTKLGNLIGIYKKAKEDHHTSFDVILDKTLTPKDDDGSTLVPPYAEFTAMAKIFKYNHDLNAKSLAAMPTSDSLEDWEKYDLYLERTLIPESSKAFEDGQHVFVIYEKKGGTTFSKSQWNSAKVKDAIEFHKKAAESIADLKGKMAEKLSHLQSTLSSMESTSEGKKKLSAITKSIGYSPKEIHVWEGELHKIESIIRKVLSVFNHD